MSFNKKAFTLIELLIVIGIIAILAAAVIIAINPGQQFAAARDATRESHINTLHTTLISYQISNQGNLSDLPITSTPTEICNTNLDSPDCSTDDLIDLSILVNEGHINQIPVDPQGGIHEDGTGYLAQGSVILVAENAETRFIGIGTTEEEYSGGEGGGESFVCGDTFTDSRDGQTYATVEIGNQCWFAEDLRYDDGCTGNTWDDTEPYDACDTQGTGYDGLLYQWEAAVDYDEGDKAGYEGAQGLCPEGWHVATDAEWTDLENWLSNNGYDGVEGDALKDPAEGWCDDSATCGGTGYLALPGGYRDTSGSLLRVGSFGFWWPSSDAGGGDAWYRYLGDSYSTVYRHSLDQAFGGSVRCLRD